MRIHERTLGILCAVAAPLPFLLWMFFDAGLTSTIFCIKQIRAGSPHSELYALHFRGSSEHFWRASILVLTVSAWATFLGVGISTILRSIRHGNPGRGPNRGITGTILCVGAVLPLAAFLLLSPSIVFWGKQLRAARLADELSPVSLALFAEWPTAVRQMDRIGAVAPHPKHADRLFVLNSHRMVAFTEGVGYLIETDASHNVILYCTAAVSVDGDQTFIVSMRDDRTEPNLDWLRDRQVHWSERIQVGESAFIAPQIPEHP